MKSDAQNRGDRLRIRSLWMAAGAAIALAPLGAHAQNAEPSLSLPALAPPANGPLYFNPPPAVVSWLDMVSATQAAQPNWMTPLVTVTPRLEQELRADFYDQQNGTGSQGNGQRIVNYGGPGGFRVEFIPAWNVELIVAAPPYETASGPKGDAWGWGDYPLFLAKYRFLSANKENGDYTVTGFFQMTEALNTEGKISNHVLTAQPTIAAGKGWGDFDIQSTLSVQIPVQGHGSPGDTPEMNRQAFGDPILWNTAFQYHFMQYFWPEPRGQLRVLAQRGARRPQPSPAHAGHHIGALQDRPGHRDAADQPDHRRRISGGGDVKSGHQKQFRRHGPGHLLGQGATMRPARNHDPAGACGSNF
jgi:hypothetical protein